MSKVTTLKRSHNAALDKADAYQELLLAAGTPEALALGAQIRQQREVASATVDGAATAKAKAKVLKETFTQADVDLKATVHGTYAIIGATDAELRPKLPEPEGWSALTGGQQAEHLIDALKKEGGKEVKSLISNLAAVAEVRRKAEKAWLAVDTGVAPVSAGSDELARLRMLIAQADVLLRAIAKPGSALYDLLKKAQRGGRTKGKGRKNSSGEDKKGDTTTTPAPKEGSTAPSQQPPPTTSGNAPSSSTTASSPPVSNGAASPPAHPPAPAPEVQPALAAMAPGAAPPVVNGVHG